MTLSLPTRRVPVAWRRALATTALLTTALAGCGSKDSDQTGGDGAKADGLASYCALVKKSKDATVPSPPPGLASGSPAAIRAWADKVIKPQIEQVDAILELAPDKVAADWRELRKVEQGLADGLDNFLQPANVKAWKKVPADQRSQRFLAQVLVGPSPCYVNDGDYIGGFNREDIDGLLQAMETNFLDWSRKMAPAIMGAPNRPDLGEELTRSFCRNDPAIAKHFARVTFQADIRAEVARATVPALILQCSDDLVAPRAVGDFLHRHLPDSVLHVIDNVGHCPHMSAPTESSRAIDNVTLKGSTTTISKSISR